MKKCYGIGSNPKGWILSGIFKCMNEWYQLIQQESYSWELLLSVVLFWILVSLVNGFICQVKLRLQVEFFQVFPLLKYAKFAHL